MLQGLIEDVLVVVVVGGGEVGVVHCRLTEPPASRLEIFTYGAESRRRDPSSPEQAVGGREPWNALRHVFYWLNLVNPA